MITQDIPTARFILYGLEPSLALQLRKAACGPGHAFHFARSTAECITLAERLNADVVFCSSEPGQYRALLNAMKRAGETLPVVVVSRIPEVSEWLDALDAGAVDYCGAPFEQHHIAWLIQSALLSSARAHA